MKKEVELGGLIRRKEIATKKFRKEKNYGVPRQQDEKKQIPKQTTQKRLLNENP